jgi:hypothetical protein
MWDNGATLPNGDPDPNWHSEDNWGGDELPKPTDDVRILSGADSFNPVRLSTTNASVKSVVSRVPFDLSDLLIVTAASEFKDSLVFGGLGRLRAEGLVTFNGTNDGRGLVLEGSIGFHNTGTFTAGTRGIRHP